MTKAEFMVEKLKVIAELKRFALANNECEIDWKVWGQKKWYLIRNTTNKYVELCDTRCIKQNDIYFTSEEIAKAAIKTIGVNRLNKYYLEVEE